jgi:hypothetical protein
MLEISVAGSAWPSTAASDWGPRSVQHEVEQGLQGLRLALIGSRQSVEDGNCEKVTTPMKPRLIDWDQEAVPDLVGCAAVGRFCGRA